jgi:predicted house-cleaning noncanonical NTP pyrophosphatase (MazG superfamily)
MSAKPQSSYLVKLVRDGMVKSQTPSGIDYRPIHDFAEFKEALLQKLGEEVTEYLLALSNGQNRSAFFELADILEVIAVAAEEFHDRGLIDVLSEATRKRELRGSFQKRIGMYATIIEDELDAS